MSDSEKSQRPWSMFRDEQGKLSWFRCFFALQLSIVNIVGVWQAVRDIEMPGAWWTIQGGLLLALAAGAGGPRALQYLGPQVGRMAGAVSEVVKRAAGRKPPTHDQEDREWVGSERP